VSGMRWSEEQYRDHIASRGQVTVSPSLAAAVPADVVATIAAEPALRQSAHGMNKLEAEYAQVLEMRLRAGEILWYGYERIKLRLADRTYYTPDFSVLLPGRLLEFHETKGFWRDDARVKIKVAAEQYPWRFIALSKRRKRDGGGWHSEVFG
jgi:hypothetical protein